MAINPETQYPGKIAPSDANYPYGSARNITVPGDGTGTPWEAAIVNDNLGFQQALLTEGAVVPSGTPDNSQASQYLDALKKVTLLSAASTFDSVASLKTGNAIGGGAVIDFAAYAAARIVVRTQSFNGGWAATMEPPKGGSFYAILTDTEYGAVPDGFADHYVGGGTDYVAMLVPDESTSAYSLGAVRDSATNMNTVFQAYADYCSAKGLAFTLDGGDDVTKEYLVTAPTVFSTAVSVVGRGSVRPRILCNATSLFDYAPGATQVSITNIRAATAVRHTTVPNALFAVRFLGDTSNRPFYNNIKNCLFDGFGKPFLTEWAWEMRIVDNFVLNCGQVLNASGASVNNHFKRNSCTGNGLAIHLGDGTNTIEGWQINENLLDAFAGCIDAVGASYCWFNDNICDHIASGTGVLFRSAGALPAIGNKIKSNYVAFTGVGSEGVRLLNNLASSANNGSTVEDNEIFAYVGGSLGKGILTDGSEEKGNKITLNNVVADNADCDINSATDCIVKNNNWNGAGFDTNVLVEYDGNQGPFIVSEVLIKRTFGGTRTEYWDNAQPASGSYQRGDTVHKLDPSLDGNNMTLIGWKRLTTGSGHVSGTDWANMYVSHVSPAT